MTSHYNTQRLVNKNIEAVNTLKQKVQDRKLIEKLGYYTAKIADMATGGAIRGVVGGILPRGVGYKVMNALDLEKKLEKNLEVFQRAIKSGDEGQINKVIKAFDKMEIPNKETYSKEEPVEVAKAETETKSEPLVRPTEIKSKVPEKYIPVLKEATQKGVISSNALAALINTENGMWKESLINPKGTDTGLGQHNDNTYKDINKLFKKNYGRSYDRKNGADNIKATALWMNYLTYQQLKSMADDKWASFNEFYK